MCKWRLLHTSLMSGMENMAVDEALLWSVSAECAAPTLRLYAWEPACLSLGYAQKSSAVDVARVGEAGWQLVRRPTGGRAILHVDELTYSVALPADHSLAAGSIVESYRRISEALISGVKQLGVEAAADQRTKAAARNDPVCFDTPSHYEVTVNGRKLVGSAQVRRRGGLLQHGALPLFGDLGRICDALVYLDEAERERARAHVRTRAITLSEALGVEVTWQQAAEAIVAGFAATFSLDFDEVDGVLTKEESAVATRLASEVYADVDWPRRQ